MHSEVIRGLAARLMVLLLASMAGQALASELGAPVKGQVYLIPSATFMGEDDDAGIDSHVQPTIGMVIFNWVDDEVAFFQERRVRQALAAGLSRTSIIERQLLGLAVRADSPLPVGSWAYLTDIPAEYPWPEADPAVARDLLARVQFEGEEGLPAFNILTPDVPALVGVAQEIAAQWSQLGFTVEVESVPIATYRERLANDDFDTALVEYAKNGSADPDVYAFWHQGQYPDGLNYGGANSTRVSKLLERGRQDASGTNRLVHYHDFQRAFIQEALAIPLYAPLFTYVVADEVAGVQLGYISRPSDRFLTLHDWRFVE